MLYVVAVLCVARIESDQTCEAYCNAPMPKRVLAIALPLAITAALTVYAFSDLGWWGVAIVAACVAYTPFEWRRERRKQREAAEIEEWKRSVG